MSTQMLEVDSAETLMRVQGIIKQITELNNDGLPLPLLVVYAWDIVEDFDKDEQYKFKASKLEVWKRMWKEADTQGFTLEYGNEALYEHLRDWLIETGQMIDVDDVNDEEDDEEYEEEEE